MSEKKKIFVISDHPLAPSGVGTQTKSREIGVTMIGWYTQSMDMAQPKWFVQFCGLKSQIYYGL